MNDSKQSKAEYLKTLRRPKLPPGLAKPSLWGTVGLLAHGLGFFVIPALVARFSWQPEGPWYFNFVLVLLTAPLAGHGLHCLGFLGHEGLHFNLHKNRRVSAYLGVIFSSITPGHMEMGFAISHWNHHRFTNGQHDPDKALFSAYRNFWSRLFGARLAASHSHFLDTVRLAFNRPLAFSYKFPLPKKDVRALALTNLCSSAFFIGLYILIAIKDPLAGIICIGLPTLCATLISGLRPYLEHAGTAEGEFVCARTRKARYFSVLFAGNNYHLEHHLYPNVPCYRLPKVHAFLQAQGCLADAHIEPGIVGAYRHAKSQSQYATVN